MVQNIVLKKKKIFSFFSLAKAPNKPIQVVYVPSHLFHMLFELFKVGCTCKFTKPFQILTLLLNLRLFSVTALKYYFSFPFLSLFLNK